MQTFTIRKAFLIPLGLLLALVFALFGVCLWQGQPTAKIVVLGLIIFPVALLFFESLARRIVVGEEEVTLFKLLRKKTLRLAEVTEVETVQVRKRVFLTLCAGDEFVILSNAYADFPALVAALLGRVSPEAVSEETDRMAANPPMKSTDIVSCWLAVALLAFILYVQLGGKF
jgi:hypothetical protein